MTDEQETGWRLERGIGEAHVTADLIGDHVNELPDAVCIEFGAQLLHTAALQQGLDDEPHRLWWIETTVGHRGVVVARNEEEARFDWAAAYPNQPDAEIREITDGESIAGFI